MNNYEYIIASFPDLDEGARTHPEIPIPRIIREIREQCSEADQKTVDFLLSAWNGENLGEEFYRTALSHRSRFIREFFAFDLHVRNAKCRFINTRIGRESDTDTVVIDCGEFLEESKISSILQRTSILGREEGLDDAYWDKIDEITALDIFDLDIVLGYLAKIKIIDRWLRLDPDKGRELMRKLVEEIRNTR